eukprot:3472824-Rhodomonas_salina.1
MNSACANLNATGWKKMCWIGGEGRKKGTGRPTGWRLTRKWGAMGRYGGSEAGPGGDHQPESQCWGQREQLEGEPRTLRLTRLAK